jgi:hypothetical protein
VENVFDSQGVVYKGFVPEEKTVNAGLCEGVMDRPLKRIQRVRPAAFCCREFFLLHDNAPAHKAANVCQFLTPNMLQPLFPPPPPPGTLQIYLRQTIFCSPRWKFSTLKMFLIGPNFADVAETANVLL